MTSNNKTDPVRLPCVFVIFLPIYYIDVSLKSQCILGIIMCTDDSPSAPAWSDPHSLQLAPPLPLRLHLHEPP